MNPKNIAVPTFVLMTCVWMCGCTTTDKFTIRNNSGGPIEKQQLVLTEPCHYDAGSDISGNLSPGPLQPDAIGIPRPSNSHVKQTMYLIHVADVEAQGKYDVASFIGVKRDGAFVHYVILHSDMPGAEPYASESDKIRFRPENCRYSMETAKLQGDRSRPK